MEQALRQAGPAATEITKDNVRTAEESYSRSKVADLKQEYLKVEPDFAEMVDCLRQEVHRYESQVALKALFERKNVALTTRISPERILEILFEASVVGVRPSNSGATRFKCEDPDLVLPASGNVYIHQGLYRGLLIREARQSTSAEPMAESGSTRDRVTIELLSIMMAALPVQDLTFLGLRPQPADVINAPSFAECSQALGVTLDIDDGGVSTRAIARPNIIYRERYNVDEAEYGILRQQLLSALEAADMAPEEYSS